MIVSMVLIAYRSCLTYIQGILSLCELSNASTPVIDGINSFECFVIFVTVQGAPLQAQLYDAGLLRHTR